MAKKIDSRYNYKEEMLIRRAAYSFEYNDGVDTDKAWRKMNGKIIAAPKKSVVLSLLKYAVVVLPIVIVVAFTLYVIPGDETQLAVKEVRIKPGETKAELILADGSSIALDEQKGALNIDQPGAKLSKDSSSNKLVYKGEKLKEGETIRYNTLRIPKGGEYPLVLSDGSIVKLNSESSIKFPVNFSGDKREVFIDGEALFEVAHDKKKPFYVHAKGMSIKVLGTLFNVSAYADEKNWHTTLVSGSVSVNPKGKNKVTLRPSYQYTLNKESGKTEVKEVDTKIYTSWVEGKFYFKGYRFEDIVKKLERWYDFNMFYMNDEIKNMKFRGVINKYEPIEDVLKKLEKTTDIEFTIKGKTVTAVKTKK